MCGLLAFIWFVLGGGAVLLSASLSGGSQVGVIDDMLREYQIRDLLHDNQWHDYTLPGISQPEVYFSPWSRLVDAPYYACARFFDIFLSHDAAVEAAIFIVPVGLFLAFAILTVLTSRQIFRHASSPLVWMLSAMSASYALLEFTPGRIDHHNMQLLGMAALLLGLVHRDKRGGWLIGLSILFSVAIGLETLPLIIVGLGGLALCAAFGDQLSTEKMIRAGVVFFACTLPLSFALFGGSGLARVQCDAFSAPWGLGLTGAGLVFMTGFVWPKFILTGRALIGAKFLSLAIAGVVLVAGLAVSFPVCLQGPYHMIGEIERVFWLDHVSLEKSVFWLAQRSGSEGVVIGLTVFTGLAGLMLMKLKAFKCRPEAGQIVAASVAIAALIIGLIQVRFLKFPFALFCPFLPWILSDMAQSGKKIWAMSKPGVMALLSAGAVIVVTGFLVPKSSGRTEADIALRANFCSPEDFTAMQGLPPGSVVMPLSQAVPMMLAGGDVYPVAAIPFHRASPGIRRAAIIFTSPESADRKIAAAPFTYVALCRAPMTADLSAMPLFKAIMTGNDPEGHDWPGLQRIRGGGQSGLAVYRIDHSKFE